MCIEYMDAGSDWSISISQDYILTHQRSIQYLCSPWTNVT
uniref:Uncharacterized protein n=1 Tax=Arundo donax TaxID=35708 RepID=A0A0A9AYW0_ARUDO